MHHHPNRPTRLAGAALVAALAAGCAGTPEGASPEALALSASCRLEGDVDAPPITLAHPDGWRLEACGRFDPEAGEPDGATDGTAVDVTWEVVDRTYREATNLTRGSQIESLPTVHEPATTVVSGHQAGRFVTERSGEHGPWQEGTVTTQWFVDLDLAGVAASSRPVLVGTVADVAGVDHAAAVDVLDAMARSIEIDDREPLDGTVVARLERGPAPWEVVIADGCARLVAFAEDREVVDESCDLDDAGVATAHLRGPGVEMPVLAGTAPADADVVGFETSAQSEGMTTGAVPLPDGRTGFALAAPGEAQRTLLARTFDGRDVGSVTVEPLGSDS